MDSAIEKKTAPAGGRSALEHLPIGAAIADLTGVHEALAALEAQGKNDIEGYLAAMPGETKRLLDLLSLSWLNHEARVLFGSREPPIRGARVAECIGTEGLATFRRIIEGLRSGEPSIDENINFTPQPGVRIPLRVRATWLNPAEAAWDSVVLFFETMKKGRTPIASCLDEMAGGKKLFKNMTLGFALFEAIFNEKGEAEDCRFLTVNPTFERMTGLDRARLTGLKARDVVPGMKDSWIAELCRVAKNGKPATTNHVAEFGGRSFEARAYRPEPGLVALLLQDVTEAVRDLKTLAEREDLFRKVLSTTAEGFFIVNDEGRFLDVNGAYCDLMGYSREEFLTLGIEDQAVSNYPGRIEEGLARIKKNGSERFETVHRRKDGRLLDVEISASYLPDAEGRGRYITFCRDISERKRTERRLREQEERLSLALGGTGAGIWDWDIPAGDMMIDSNWGKILGQEIGSFGSLRKSDWDKLCHADDIRESELALMDHFTGHNPRYECEMRMRHVGGHWVWVRNQGEVVERDPQGRPTRVIGLMFDIGQQKDNESRMRTTIAEKESLLSELYHRTKNSMQLINAMLELKKQELGDPSSASAFDDIQNKILAMALVQEKLYQADTLSSIDLGSYVNDLMDLLSSEMSTEGKRIDFKSKGELVEVTADIAIPCGLIVSELVGNSVSHAFTSRDRGSVSVSVYKDATGEIHIEEWDDGVGLPEGFDPRRAGRVGLRTVIGIGEEQLHGLVTFGDKASGFSCELKFRDVYYPRRV